MTDIQRVALPLLEVTVGATNSAEADPVDFRFASGGIVHVPSAFATAATFVFYVNDTAVHDESYWPLYDSDGGPVQITVAAGKSYELPGALFAAKFFRIVNAAGAGDVILDLKG